MANERHLLEQLKAGPHFAIDDHPTDWLPKPWRDTDGKDELKALAEKHLAEHKRQLSDLQEQLFAADRHAVLLVFQAMDAGGKDGTIRHVLSGVNPQGCQVTAFKQPSVEELSHDFLWRSARALPERGRIGVFNRSYYEEVLVVRVHPELLEAQRLPGDVKPAKLWKQRFRSIRAFEEHLTRNGTVVVKFFLNLGKEEQRKRFLSRLDEPEKNWKFSATDVEERDHWGHYRKAYQEAIRATSSDDAPWYVVPADRKPVMRALVASVIVQTLGQLDLSVPDQSDEQRSELQRARTLLEAEDDA